ncbi:MAG: YggS family pyridoxal phosphate-dependent enzyme [Propionicimonas sp.]|uniref:YggS family pyridoxal phosphate-dependent enzyme n=1 Tax=Propionicimonas sp. TaxID=1955623 RepID=UPI003D0971B5
MPDIAANLAAVRARIDTACVEAGRAPGSVRLLPVSKTRPASDVLAAHAAGYSRFGENKVQEASAKASDLEGTPGLEWVMIGHLQTNKARVVAGFASEFQALDSLPLAAELDRRLQTAGRRLDVLIQVNSSAEDSKFGLPPQDVPAFAKGLTPFDALQVRGLMTLALPSPDPAQVGACFERVVDVQRRLRDASVDGQGYDELSMGMSGDFELAIAHGATVVRLGTAIFGARG